MLIKAGGSAVVAHMASVMGTAPENAHAAQTQSKSASIKVTDNKVYVDTASLTAIIDRGFIVSLKSKATGEEFIEKPDVTGTAALRIVYTADDTANIDDAKFGSIITRQLSDKRAEILFHSWDGDGVIALSVDEERGDMLIEPSAYSSRPGVRACRWCLAGLRADLDLVAPFFQGIKLNPNDALIRNTHWEWPMYWEAGMAVLQSKRGGFWIHTRDNRYRYKALQVGSKSDPYEIGLDSEAYGPVDNSLSAGGLCWRINVFEGDWHVPAAEYRTWYWQAYELAKEEQLRRPWLQTLKLAISWCPGEPDILDALAKKVKPGHVLLHFPDWRTDAYDENYPNYTASDSGKEFIRKCQSMGFHVMPHFNSIDMDPSNPVYSQIRDFQYRTLEKKQLLGWSWYQGRGIGVPESNMNLLNNRDKKVMVKIHPGLGMWRSILGERILTASQELSLDSVFIDVTLHSSNIYNCFVESTTPSEGMKKLIGHMATLGQGLAVGGEGLNEITAQGQSFAQAHLFNSWHESTAGLERAGGCDLNEFLFGKLCRTIGYSGLGGRNADEELRMRIHLEHGAIPTITVRSAQDIINPNPAVKKLLDMAG